MKRFLILLFLCIICGIHTEAISGSNQDKVHGDRSIKGKVIMKRAFDRFHINYEMSRLHKVGYYGESMADSSEIYYSAESIVEIYIPHNLDQNKNASIIPIKARKVANKEIDSEDLLYGNASDMARSSIWRPHSFVGEKSRKNHRFEYLRDSAIDGSTVFVISFEPKKNKGFASGKLYIDKESYAIIKTEYTPLVKNSKVWKQVSWSEEFEFRNGAYELSKVYFFGKSFDDRFSYNAILVMNQLEVVSSFPEYEGFIRESESLFETASEEFGEDFWKGYDFLRKKINSDLLTAEM